MKKLINWLSEPINFFGLLCSLIPAAMVLVYKLNQTTLLPISDVWVSGQPIAIKTYDGSLQLADLFSPYIEHRLFFTKLLVAISTLTTGWNPYFETLATFVLGALTLLMLIDIVRREQWVPIILVIVPFSLIIFSLRQSANLLLGFDGVWLFVLFFTTATFWVLRRGAISWRTLILAAIMAACSSFSVAAGLMTWFAALITMWMLGYRKPIYYVFWIVATGITFFFYYYGLPSSGFKGASLSQWQLIINYALLVIGSPFSIYTINTPPSVRALIVVVLGLCLFTANIAYLWWKTQNLSKLAIWVGLAAFTLLVALITGYGRLNVFGLSAAATSRYTTLPLLFWVGLVAVGTSVVRILPRSKPSLIHSVLAYSNMVFGAVAIFFLIQASVSEATHTPFLLSGNKFQIRNSALDCMASGILGNDVGCLRSSTNAGISGDEPAEKWALEMASRRLGIWENYQVPMPSDFKPDDRIVVLAPFAGQHVDLTFAGSNQLIPNDHILRVVRADEVNMLRKNLNQLGSVITGFEAPDRKQIETFIQGINRVWFVQSSGDDAFASQFKDFFVRYFDRITNGINAETAQQSPYPVLALYQRAVTTADCQLSPNANGVDLKDSGDFLFNQGVKVITSTAFEQNDYPELYVRLKFENVKILPAKTYSAAVHILDATGAKPLQYDFPIPATDQACQMRFVLNTLPPGTYSVNLIVYQWDSGKRVSLDNVASANQTDPQFIRKLSQFSINASSN
ncbi:MAG: hypothetical protein H0X30_31255 [Anaerolineae bacterium]|nr:hypothetical protein [Anaerolineae bacterium]